MIQAETIQTIIGEILTARQLFLVGVELKQPGKIMVYLDSMKGVTIDDCAAVSRVIESWLNSEGEDSELEVSSPGPERSLLLPLQYEKHIGRKVDVLRNDGIRLQGVLKYFSGGRVGIESEHMVREGKKGKRRKETRMTEIGMEQIIKARIIFSEK